ncbi:alanine/glycine:cation symporter family protein [Telluribacter sp.]|jgi:AGCS family alanine or glycine:cation symporter|uniref:alanine/glycine:cation symporter family protein n=1 Tax=Telluribacter sp. TaxID=1978767 RepID=UPI002E135375|nr:alanine/glycine:cation symporter family protein [Telluribacter sp.]
MSKKFLLLSALGYFTTLAPLFAQAPSGGLDKQINDVVQPATDFVSGIVFYSIQLGDSAATNMPLVIIFLLLSAILFTVYFKFINIRGFGTSIQTVQGKYSDPTNAGEVSHFQALTAAVSGTVGLGNIAGVAIAISLGGPGATFWMIVAGFLGMSSKFVECTLGVRYREIGPDGKVYGGPMYYLTKGLADRGLGGVGKVLAVFFAIMCVGGSFGGGNMFQANQAASQFLTMIGSTSSSAGTVFGVVMAAVVAMVIIGGIKRIGAVTEKIVPFMCGIYILAALVVIGVNIANLPETLALIFTEAFSPVAVSGGLVGVLVQGFRRAAFSNEAGVGSAAIAHSAVKTEYPASEGLVSLLEPFIDTVIICTMTAIVVIITGDYDNAGNMGGVEMTSESFATVLPWFPYVLTFTVVLFAFSTMISWSYYGLQAWLFLFGKNRFNDILYKVLFCFFVVIGAAASLSAVTDFSDAMIFAMSVPNLIGLFFLLPVVKAEVTRYMAFIKGGTWKK